jgi:LEA14-like dessication related protein
MKRLAFAVALVAAVGCSHRKPKPPPPVAAPLPVELPQIAFEAAQLDEFKFTQALMTFRCRVDNPNPFPLSVTRVRFAIQLEGKPAAAGEVASAFEIPAMAPDRIPGQGAVSFPVAIQFGSIPGFAAVMAARREAGYTLSGAVAFNTPFGVVEVPISTGGVLAVPRMPDFQVLRLQLRSASPMEVVLELRIRVGNTNGFPLPSASLDYALVVSEKEIARAVGRLEAPVAPGESAELTVPIRISVFKAGKTAARFLLPFASLDVALKGGFNFDGVPIPLDLKADVLPKS